MVGSNAHVSPEYRYMSYIFEMEVVSTRQPTAENASDIASYVPRTSCVLEYFPDTLGIEQHRLNKQNYSKLYLQESLKPLKCNSGIMTPRKSKSCPLGE